MEKGSAVLELQRYDKCAQHLQENVLDTCAVVAVSQHPF